MGTQVVCPRCGKAEVHTLPLEVLPNAYYECRGCGHVWKIPPDPPRARVVGFPATPKPDDVLPLNCPKCPRELIYITSTASIPRGEPDSHFYRCPDHGGWKVPPNGRFVAYSFTT